MGPTTQHLRQGQSHRRRRQPLRAQQPLCAAGSSPGRLRSCAACRGDPSRSPARPGCRRGRSASIRAGRPRAVAEAANIIADRPFADIDRHLGPAAGEDLGAETDLEGAHGIPHRRREDADRRHEEGVEGLGPSKDSGPGGAWHPASGPGTERARRLGGRIRRHSRGDRRGLRRDTTSAGSTRGLDAAAVSTAGCSRATRWERTGALPLRVSVGRAGRAGTTAGVRGAARAESSAWLTSSLHQGSIRGRPGRSASDSPHRTPVEPGRAAVSIRAVRRRDGSRCSRAEGYTSAAGSAPPAHLPQLMIA